MLKYKNKLFVNQELNMICEMELIKQNKLQALYILF